MHFCFSILTFTKKASVKFVAPKLLFYSTIQLIENYGELKKNNRFDREYLVRSGLQTKTVLFSQNQNTGLHSLCVNEYLICGRKRRKKRSDKIPQS